MLNSSTGPRTPLRHRATSARSDTRARILLVDDEPLNIQVLAGVLSEDYALSFAVSGEEALHLADSGLEPDLILLDIVMPDMDGFEVCARLKSNVHTAGIPVIYLTGLSNPAHEERGLRAGGVDYIRKPFRAELVRARVRLHIELQQRTHEAMRAAEQLRQQATRDELTQLPNRRAFEVQLRQTLAECRRHGRRFGLLAIDLDHFKPVNDRYGHAAGDQVLKTVAQRLRRSVRSEDTVSRVGGDEFLAILTDADSLDRTSAAIERILSSLSREVAVKGGAVQVGASIGVAIFPDVAQEMDALLEHADAACYEAKRAGRNTYRLRPRAIADMGVGGNTKAKVGHRGADGPAG